MGNKRATGVIDRLMRKPGKKHLALLLDPESVSIKQALLLANQAENVGFSMILVGGSLISSPIDKFILTLKAKVNIPVIIFPGSLLQLSPGADGLLLLSLISGRNPELLIGQHVQAAPFIKKLGIEVIPTGYVIVDSGKPTSVEYMSHTMPVPSGKPDIAAATALAGELLGMKLIYLEAGSGADKSVPVALIRKVRSEISVPLMVGGGVRNTRQLKEVFDAGADIVVIGTALEQDPDLVTEFGKGLF